MWRGVFCALPDAACCAAALLLLRVSIKLRGKEELRRGCVFVSYATASGWGAQEHKLLMSGMQNCFQRGWGEFGDMNCRALQNKLNISRQNCLAFGSA